MNIPLIATASSRGVMIISDKRVRYIPVPFEPYAFAQKDGVVSDAPSKVLINFTTRKETTVYIFKTGSEPLKDIDKLRDKGWRVEHNKFKEQIMIDQPDFFRSFPSTNPDVMSIDIEVLTTGTGIFPRAETAPIISIAAKYQDDAPVVFMNYGRGARADKRILLDFLGYLKEKNPDIIVTYNGARFDIPYIYKRAQICGIRLEEYSRLKRDWLFADTYSIPGAIHYDLYKVDIAKDQSILGIQDRKLKTVAEWFGIPTIKLSSNESGNTQKLIGTTRLRDYNASDVQITMELYKIFYLNHFMLAEILGVPLDDTINTYPSFASKIILARSLRKLGFVFLDSNEARYPHLAGRYEGAIVNIFKKGFIPKVWKLDVSGFYPSTMMTFNISPETTKIEATEEFSGVWKHRLVGGKFWMRIPDKKLQKDIIISIDQSTRGILPVLLEGMRAERAKLKETVKQSKKTMDTSSEKAAKAQSDALKVIMNSVYGAAALPESVYSDLGVALATISICRYIFQRVIEKHRPDIIEADSVLGDTPIWYRKIGEQPNIALIKHLYPGTEDGRILQNDIEVLGLHGWSKADYVYRHTVSKPCYRIATGEGFVDVTEDHSILDPRGKELKPPEMRVGDAIGSVTTHLSMSGEDIITPKYARALGWICSNMSPGQDDISFCEEVPSTIREIISNAHPGTDATLDDETKTYRYTGTFAARVLNVCFQDSNPKVPRAILNGSPENAKAFLLGHRSGSVDIGPLMAAGLSHLARKIGKFPGIRSGENIILAQKSQPGSGLVTKIERLGGGERQVYDISTADGSFSAALGNIALHNTDGIYVDVPVEAQVVEDWITFIIEEMIGTKSEITVERDTYGPGWFHLAKNYILRDTTSGRIIFHGVAFKSSSHSGIYNKILRKVSDLVLSRETEEYIWDIINPMLDLKIYSLEDFTMRTTVRQEFEEYANERAIQVRLSKQAEALGIAVTPGTMIEYIVTKGRTYTIASMVRSVNDVDHEYYQTEVSKALALFRLGEIQQLKLL